MSPSTNNCINIPYVDGNIPTAQVYEVYMLKTIYGMRELAVCITTPFSSVYY